MPYKKITIITPNYNGGQYLEETIRSVVKQGYPNLEYIIIDGGSTDNSIDIIKKYEKYLTYWISEPDTGLYHALNKGFAVSTGEIMGWLNSDDMLHPKALFIINELFNINKIKWLQGIPTIYDEHGRTIYVTDFYNWSKYDFWRGRYEWIQQESTYWHRDLWNKTGSKLNQDLKYAGDLDLWNRFFFYEKLYCTKTLIGGFRIRSINQLSLNHLKEYHNEALEVLKANSHSVEVENQFKRLNKLEKIKSMLMKSKILNFNPIIFRINAKINKLKDYPAQIQFDRMEQKFILKKN